MNALIWYFASGRSFWAGLALMGTASLVYWFIAGTVLRRVSALVYFAGVLFVFLSATPLSWFVSVGFWLFSSMWAVAVCIGRVPRRLTIPLVWGTVGVVVAATAAEYGYHCTPSILRSDWETITVVGDSVSSGIGGPGETAWPKRLEQLLGRPVNSLAVAGATTETAVRRQLPKITQTNGLVFLEIGGNDLLNNTPPDVFEAALGKLLEELVQHNHTVVLFELPRLIWHRQHGRIQRELARKYGIILIPRTFLADIFKGKELTSDAIHLTQYGHDVFAEKVYALFEGRIDGR